MVPFAPRPAFAFWPSGAAPKVVGSGRSRTDSQAERERLGLPERYLVYSGRYDARQDLSTLLAAIELLARSARPADLPDDVPWPPRVLLLDASPVGSRRPCPGRRARGRRATRSRMPRTSPTIERPRSSVVRGRRSCPRSRTRWVCRRSRRWPAGRRSSRRRSGRCRSIVGTAGILVEPRNPERLASALATVWADDRVHAGLVGLASDRAEARTWTGADVARATRRIYAAVATAG